MKTHVDVLAWINIVYGALMAAIGMLVFGIMTTIGAVSGDLEAAAILTLIATGVGIFLVVLGLPSILAGVGLLKRRNWGRILAIVLGVLGILNFPLGTAVGIYTLWVLLNNEAAALFS